MMAFGHQRHHPMGPADASEGVSGTFHVAVLEELHPRHNVRIEIVHVVP